jgi:hypothetical protein
MTYHTASVALKYLERSVVCTINEQPFSDTLFIEMAVNSLMLTLMKGGDEGYATL